MTIRKRTAALRFIVMCLGILLMMLALAACGVQEEQNIGQTIGGEKGNANDEKVDDQKVDDENVNGEMSTIDGAITMDGKHSKEDTTPNSSRPQTDISTIRIKNGNTGQDLFLSKESDSKDFWEIIEKWESLDLEKAENQTRTVGYDYWLSMEDEEGAELHDVVPKMQEIQIDGVNYHDYSRGTAMELLLAVDAAWEKTQSTTIAQKPSDFQTPDLLEGVTMKVTYATSRGANLVFSNDTDLEIECGDDYSLQAYVDGAWHDVEYIIDNAAFNAIAYTVPQNGTRSWGVRWTFFHGELPPGDYRIVKSVMDFRGTGDYTIYQLAAEFSIE